MISNVGLVYREETANLYKYNIVFTPDPANGNKFRLKRNGNTTLTLPADPRNAYTGIAIGKEGGPVYTVYNLSPSGVETLIATITFPNNMSGPNDYQITHHNGGGNGG